MSFINKNSRAVFIIGFAMIFLGWGFRPMMMNPPGVNDKGYYLIYPTTNEKIYSAEASTLFWKYYTFSTVSVSGFAIIAFAVLLSLKTLQEKKSKKKIEAN